MIYTLDEHIVGEWINFEELSLNPVQRWYNQILIFNKNGLLKKKYFIGAKDCLIESIEYSEGEHGCLNAEMYVRYFDVLLEYGDLVVVRYNNINDYMGYVVSYPDSVGGTVKINSLINRLNEQVYRGSFVNKTKTEILETIILAHSAKTGVKWNTALIELESAEVFSPNYESIKDKTIIDEWGNSEDDSFWGVNEFAYFFTKFREASATFSIYPGQYETAEYTPIDYTKIEFTKIALYRNEEDVDGNKQEVFIDNIPNGETEFPVFTDIENIIGEKIKKDVAPDELDANESKLWAFGEVQAEVQKAVDTLDITGLLHTIRVRPGDNIRVYVEPKFEFKRNVETESLSNWATAILNADSYKDDYSIEVEESAIYTFPYKLSLSDCKKLVFYAKSSNYGNAGIVSARVFDKDYFFLTTEDGFILTTEDGDPLITENGIEVIELGQVFIAVSNNWNYISFDFTNKRIISLIFELTETLIDFIHIFAVFRQYYELTVQERTVKLSEGNLEKYEVKLGAYDNSLNDLQFELQKTIERRSK